MGKYFKYAIGEIILVVIGILIALSINNWNSNRIEKKAETKTLLELRKGLISDYNILETNLNSVHGQINRLLLLKELLKDNEQPYNKGLDTLFGAVYGIQTIRLNIAFYEDLKASGLKLIKNDDVRLKIVNLFEEDYAIYANNFEIELHLNEVTRPYYLTNFKDIKFRQSATPNDFNKIWTDPYYKNIVDYRIINLQSNHVNPYNRTMPKMDTLINDITSYLEQ